MNDCVFCAQPIHADQPVAGRPPMAAHATCADAALADDRHWDAVAAAASPIPEESEGPRSRADPGRASSRTGCLPWAAGLVVILAAATRLSSRR